MSYWYSLFSHQRDDLTWKGSRGITGVGVPVAVVEVGGQINTANPFLAGVTQDLTFSCLSFHAAAVAGIIRSTDAPEMGVAPGANLWVGGSCGGTPRSYRTGPLRLQPGAPERSI